MSKDFMDKKYNPSEFEEELYKIWEKKGYFKPTNDNTKQNYCIMMPPPNVTGKLHMGHALDGTLQDILIRYKRMKGFNTLWLPGTDHSAISTEVKVVQKLKKEGKDKLDIGREAFLDEAWNWTKEYGGTIVKQQRKMGLSCDWEHSRFTLDEGMSKAVLKVFKDLYDKGLIYKGKKMINWCPCCQTSISDAEVERIEEDSNLWYIRYKVVGEDKDIIVATTRPETMLGDSGVAVNPKDERYKSLVGKKCIVPIVNREIPIIADEMVEMEFGTGCVKITPAHDMNDYQTGIRHNLDFIEVFDEKNIMLDLVPQYVGMDIKDARKLIVEKLKELDVLEKTEEYKHNPGVHDRCKTIVEPRISDQWFVSMKEMAKPAIEAIKNGTSKFVPQKFEKTYLNWLENIQDWCISRQIWWGHQIPVYYCNDCGHLTVSDEKVSTCEKCNSDNIYQDPDTLDTWFSSALWPFSTLGWPEKTKDFENFFPTNTLVTGYDIITFWVVRMMTSSLEQTKQVPFKDILIHGIVRDANGLKMSKSLGNGIDPLDVIEKYSADALRFSLISGTTIGNDLRFIPEKLEMAKNFANKIWNASKFVMLNLEDYDKNYKVQKLLVEDKWILSKLNNLIQDINQNFDNYDLGVALDSIYEFIWNEFCDWYVEIAKTRLYNKEQTKEVIESRKTAQYVLRHVLLQSLKLLHPFMPFVTEYIYMQFEDGSIMISNYPEFDAKNNYIEEQNYINEIKGVITDIRNVRAKMNVHPAKKSKLILIAKKYEKEINESIEFLKKLGFANEIIILSSKEEINEKTLKNSINIVSANMEIFIPFEELVNIEEEIKRLEKEIEKNKTEKEKLDIMLSNPGFINKAPKQKVEETKTKQKEFEDIIDNLNNRIKELNNM